MQTYPWEPFLKQWNKELLAAPDADDLNLPPEVLQPGWLGFPGATEDQIAAAEARLGIDKFPPSYRQFLAFTNGWRHTGTFIDHLWSAEEVDWLRVRNGDLIEIYGDFPDPPLSDEKYRDYDDDETASHIRTEHLATTLEISDVGDSALYILNPNIVNADGEWEAWFYASWTPGFRRYPSFWALMQAEYESFKSLNAQEEIRYRPDKIPGTLHEKLPGLIQELARTADAMAQLSQQQRSVNPFNDLTDNYNSGFMQALRDAARRVQQLMIETSDEAALLNKLKQLAETIGLEAQALQPGLNTADIFRIAADPAQVSEALGNGGAMAGKQKAAGIIQWFLNL